MVSVWVIGIPLYKDFGSQAKTFFQGVVIQVRQVRYPVYLPGLPLTDIASLERWVPTSPLVPPTVTRHDVEQSGLTTPGPLSIGES